MELEQQLTELTSVISTFKEKAQQEIKTLGATTQTTADQMIAIQKQVDAIDVKLAQKHVATDAEKPMLETLKENESLSRLMKDGRGRATIELTPKQSQQLMERKTTLTTTGGASLSTTGVLQIDRMAGITTEARQALTIRDVLNAAPTSMQVVDYVKVSTALSPASPQVEASAKFENTVTFTALSERIKLIATFLRASRQILDDMTELQNFLMSSLPYYTNLEEELQLLSGNAAGENLNGLITQATAFNTGLLSAPHGWNTIDILGRAVQQVAVAKEVEPTFVVLHPTDWWNMRLTKDAFGRYILGDPQAQIEPILFGKRVVSTTSIASGTFVLGTGNPACSQIRDRLGMQVDISTEDATNFTTNLVTIRAEKRMALVVRRPGSYITGTFNTSP